MESTTLYLSFAVFLLLYGLYKRWNRISVDDIPGPPSGSFLYGVLPELFKGEAAAKDYKWVREYGKVIRVLGPIRQPYLLISDPKALQYIYHTAGYRFNKHAERIAISRIFAGEYGLAFVEGHVHKRQRKVMLPGFGAPETKAFVPVFSQIASKVSSKWKDIMTLSSDESIVVNVSSWIARATLDTIGIVAFDYEFNTLDNADNELARAYSDLFVDTFGSVTNGQLLFIALAKYIPNSLLRALLAHSPSKTLEHAFETKRLSLKVAKRLVEEKAEALLQGKGSRDIMSLLVKANASEDPSTRLTELELLSQMQTIILAGHETTANSIGWGLHQLSQRPDIQAKLRTEIREQEKLIAARGDDHFSAQDIENMPYLNALTKEIFRFYPVAYNLMRQSTADDVLPLSEPIVTVSGKVIHELPIPKGQKIIASVATYNRLKEVFGEDADQFNPERWLNATMSGKSTLGVYSNLLTFAGGLRSCIGWRFAVLEVQAFLIELINSFQFYPTEESKRVIPAPCAVMAPTIDGDVTKGTKLPLRVRVSERDE